VLSNRPTVDKRSDRIAKRFELPVLIAALLVIPVIVIEQSGWGEPWKTLAAVANWLIWLVWLVFLAEFVAASPPDLSARPTVAALAARATHTEVLLARRRALRGSARARDGSRRRSCLRCRGTQESLDVGRRVVGRGDHDHRRLRRLRRGQDRSASLLARRLAG
jgi:hypothetical protein